MPCNFNYEKKIIKTFSSVAGVDEAGRGALAGPVVAAMVILNPKKISTEINDSKKIPPWRRDSLATKIKQNALTYAIGIISQSEIDKINILQATLKGVIKCFEKINPQPQHLLLDALKLPQLEVSQTSLIKGDEISYSIAAASILAKTTRDAIMRNLSQQYPQYGFEHNKGYGVKFHLQALKKFGATPVHRKTFKPVKEVEEKNLLFD